jgi:hypothetical protein
MGMKFTALIFLSVFSFLFAESSAIAKKPVPLKYDTIGDGTTATTSATPSGCSCDASQLGGTTSLAYQQCMSSDVCTGKTTTQTQSNSTSSTSDQTGYTAPKCENLDCSSQPRVEDTCYSAWSAQCSNSSNGNNNSNNNSASGVSYDQDCGQLQGLIDKCNSQLSSTDTFCDQKSNSDLNSVDSMAGQIITLMGQQTSSSLSAACGRMASLSQAANAAWAGYATACNTAISGCSSTCSAVDNYLKVNKQCTGSPMAAQCQAYSSKTNQANMAMSNYTATMSQSSNCSALNGSTPTVCTLYPTASGCGTVTNLDDCNTSATAAATQVCICYKNPSASGCTAVSANSQTDSPLGKVDLASTTASTAASNYDPGDITGLPAVQQAALQNQTGQGIDGKQGGGANLGGSGGSGGANPATGGRGGAKEKDQIAVNSGFYGGGGGGSSWGSGGGGSQGGGGGIGGYLSAIKNKMPNLRQFLPGGQFDPKLRGIAGESGPDGMTGPNSNIWQKIQNRYQVTSPTLLP